METSSTLSQGWSELLLRGQLSDDELRDVLDPVGFAELAAAYRAFQRLGSDNRIKPSLIDLLPHLLAALSEAAGPDRVLVHLQRYTQNAGDQPAAFGYLADNPRAVEVLVTLFAGSQFLTEILLRNPEYLQMLMAHKELAQPKSVDEFCAEAAACTVAPDDAVEHLDALRRYQRLELLRIGACDLLGLYDLATMTAQLSNLADSLVRACLSIVSAQTGRSSEGFVVLAMGKLGGRELNYSSDVDLLFLAGSDPTSYLRLGERLIAALNAPATLGPGRCAGILA
jgi:glutamate-ammonia-ligase adenylyltransferase